MSPPDRNNNPETPASADQHLALQGLIGIETFKHSARLAGFAGAGLLLLAALVSWLGIPITHLPIYWLTWAGIPAVIAMLLGPLLGRQLLSRRYLTLWRLALVALMSLNSTAWAFASAIAVSHQPQSVVLLVIASLALALALLPTVSWFAGLLLQLFIQLIFTAALAMFPEYGLQAFVLPLGVSASIVFLALTAALYARRVDLAKADSHYLRIEASELQQRLRAADEGSARAEQRQLTLEAELAEILDLAEDANRAKTEFLATMSHEIRTPLNGILPILEMLRDTPLNTEQLKYVHTAQSSSRHLLRIINDILDFAKVESGKLQLESIEIDVRDLVGSVTELMGSSAGNRNLRLSAHIADNVPQVVRGDPIRLRQILINLVSNAIKFTEEGGIRVEVTRGESSNKEVELLFAVADTGVGMPAETTDRLFQLFTQADASTTRKHGGTGLGLVICKRLVELMGGNIGVRSSPGQGSTFWFLVPLRKSVMEVPSLRRDLRGVRILTLITDPEIAARVSEHLRRWMITEERSGEPGEALAKLRSTSMLGESWSYELVLIDATGVEARLPSLLAEMRSIEAVQQLKIIVAVRSDTLANLLKRDYGVLVLSDALRPEPLRRMLYRLFDVETRQFGVTELRTDEVYDDLNVAAPEADVEQPAAVSSGAFSGKVLLVEDNPVNLGVMQKAMSKLGLSCDPATDGRQALALFEQARFDLVFMDCQMPVMDGYQSTRRMRQWEKTNQRPATPIVAMTANAMEGDRDRCIDAGMDDYLAKPVSLEQLRNCLGEWLRSDRPAQSGTGTSAAVQVTAGDKEALLSMVLDETVLQELREIMDDDYLALLHTFLDNAPQLLVEARSAVDRSDVSALVNPVHSLKSSSANVGAMRLSALARSTEKLARSGEIGDAATAFVAVEAAYREAEMALREHVLACSAA